MFLRVFGVANHDSQVRVSKFYAETVFANLNKPKRITAVIFFPLALPRANDMDVESFVALFLFLGFFVLFLDVFFLFTK